MKALIILSPAYGRKFKTSKQAVDSYLAGQDFINNLGGGRYCSCRDFYGKTVSIWMGPGLYLEISLDEKGNLIKLW